MTREQAKLLNMDVYNFSATAEADRQRFAENMRGQDRTVFEFEETVAGFKLLSLAVGQRAEYGQTAKTVRRFIGEQ